MKARPILFSAPMVRALLAGTKTQTRREIKYSRRFPIDFVGGGGKDGPDWNDPCCWGWECDDGTFVTLNECKFTGSKQIQCPYGCGGQYLWVRETWARYKIDQDSCEIAYRATPAPDWPEDGNWRPSIFMPRQHSRLTLRITDVRVQRLLDITHADAIAEGISKYGERWECPGIVVTPDGPISAYKCVWEYVNGVGSWAANPWVWCVSFAVIQKNVDEVLHERP